jgi:hypothetical protein
MNGLKERGVDRGSSGQRAASGPLVVRCRTGLCYAMTIDDRARKAAGERITGGVSQAISTRLLPWRGAFVW